MEAFSSNLKSSVVMGVLTVGAAAVGTLALKRVLFKRQPGPRVANYEKDMVYLFTFPSTRTAVTVSPFALKLETWLRMKRIRYSAARKMHVWSSKGQIPFVELNGEEFNESNLTIGKLADYFNLQDELSDEQLGFARGLDVMLDNQTFYSYMYYRVVLQAVKFFQTWEFLSWPTRQFLVLTFPSYWRRRCRYHGIGKNTVSEIYTMGCDDILALSRVLGSKRYLLGDSMTTVDCYAFGHLAQLMYNTLDYPHLQFMRQQTPNLCDYIDRIKQELWPDWHQICMDNLHGSKDL